MNQSFNGQSLTRVSKCAHLRNEAIKKCEEIITIKIRIVDMEGLLEWLEKYYFFTWLVVMKVWPYNNSPFHTFVLCALCIFK